jgi:hypothetical protein
MKRVKKPRVPRTHAGGTMTKSAYFTFIRSALRQKWLRYPPRYQVLAACSRRVEGKRHKVEHKCDMCNKWHKKADVEVDHIVACGSFTKFEDLGGFAERMFCEPDGLQVLCKPCHYLKTHGKEKAK